MNREEKAAVIEEIAVQIRESDAVFAVDYRGITVAQAATLRTKLRDADASFRVVKNTLTERAADQVDASALKALLEGPTALTFVKGDVAAAAKAIADEQRTTEKLAFKGGMLGGDLLDPAQLSAIAKLPSRDVLYQQLVGMVAFPLSGLARTMNQLIGGLAIALAGVQEKKESGEIPSGAAPAAPAASEPAAEEVAEEAPAEAGNTEEAAPEASAEAGSTGSTEDPTEGSDTTDETPQEN